MSESETRADIRLVAGRYKLGSELGRGGMGTVWLADDTLTGRQVAVKELRPQRGSSDEDRQAHLRRALQEARSAARISHPNAVTLYDVIPASTADDAIYLIMELIDGPTLIGLVLREGGTLPAPLVARFGLQLLDVLEAAHGLGIVHRDIKPGNVLIARGDQAKLTDFGIAHLVGGTRLTRAGTAGTLAYMAPELFQGEEISAGNDLWSLGSTLFYAADGRVPFERDTDAATMHAILEEDIPVPGCAPDLAGVISGMLRRDPGQRLTIGQARDLLRPVAAQDPATSGPPAPPAPQWPSGAQTGAPSGAQTGAPRQGAVSWDDKASTGLWDGTPTGLATGTGAGQAPAPARKSRRWKPRLSRKTLVITAAIALVMGAAGAVAGIVLPESGGGPLSLRATMTNPGGNPVNHVAFSTKGSTLVTTDDTRTTSSQSAAILWDTASHTAVHPFPYAGSANGVAFSSDGTKLAIASDKLYVYNAANYANLVYDPNVSPAESVAFGPGGSTLAVGGRWNSTANVGLRNPPAPGEGTIMPGLTPDSYVSAVAFSPDGKTLAASDAANGKLYVWDTGTRGPLTAPVPLTQSTGPLAFSPDGKTLAVADGGPGEVRLWNVASKTWTATLADPQGQRVNGIAYSHDGRTLAVADGNGAVDLWDTAKGTLIAAQQVNAKGVEAVAFSPDGKTLATGDGAGQLKLWAASGQ